jgi:hypothetical protein
LRTAAAIIGLCFAGIASAAAADPRGTCEQLAANARASPPAAWRAKLQALAPDLTLVERSRKESPVETQIAAMPELAKALSNEDGQYSTFVERLPRTDVYLVYTVSGTLICQSLAFVAAEPGRRPRMIASPPLLQDGLCWTSAGRAGSIFGKPAFVVTETFTVDQPARESIQITPWTGPGWGAACRLELDYRTQDRLTERFCADAAACNAIAPLAVAIAEAHRRPRKQDEPFRFDRTPIDDAAIQAARAGASQAAAPELPTFGAKAKTAFTSFSYGDVDYFPLTAGGARYVAAVGYGGVGWREIGDALLAVYAVRGGVARSVAGFVVTRSIVGLRGASVEPPKPVGGD